MSRQSSQWLIPIALVLGAAGALWYYWIRVAPPEPPPVDIQQPVVAETTETTGPLHPVQAEAEADEVDRSALVSLPPLDQSDDYFKLAITDLFGDSISEALENTGMIERVVATIDNLPRAHVAEKIRPVGTPDGQFLADGQDDSGQFSISGDNYRRYDFLIDIIFSSDSAEIAELYRRFYPLFQSAYVDLGYPGAYFNDRLVDVIDHLLETPDVSGPIELVRPHVLYEYRDAELESLSSGQKLMLRIGDEHAEDVKTTLRELRALITTM